MDILRPTHLWIDTEQLQGNFRALQNLLGPSRFLCPMIKANAYGHGDLIVAETMAKAGCQWVGVASVEEGLQLRGNGVRGGILVFGFFGRAAAKALLEHSLVPVVSDLDQLEHLGREAHQPLGLHLKWNTGMNRLGFRPEQFERVQELLDSYPHLKVVGMGTHLHTAEDILESQSSARQQIEIFAKICQKRGSWAQTDLHVYNSAAVTALHSAGHPLSYGMRPGLLTYGVAPEGFSLPESLGPVLSFRSAIVAIQLVRQGEVVSYGGTWRAARDARIAIVPAGYGDGVSRSLSDRGQVLIGGKRCPIRGRVCMDYTLVDVTDMEGRELVGEPVLFIGRQGQEEITVNEVAQFAQRSPYEILTSISERVPRLSSQGVF